MRRSCHSARVSSSSFASGAGGGNARSLTATLDRDAANAQWSADGRHLFVSSRNQQFPDNTFRYTPRYPLDADGDGIPDNMMAGHIAVIDTQSLEVVKVIEVEAFASGLALYE